jgi:preprotein translocase subunit SecE
MAKFKLFKFLQEVRAETEKVTWPTRRETAITTAMVFIMVAIAAVFFLIADQLMNLLIQSILGIRELSPITLAIIAGGLGLLAYLAWGLNKTGRRGG